MPSEATLSVSNATPVLRPIVQPPQQAEPTSLNLYAHEKVTKVASPAVASSPQNRSFGNLSIDSSITVPPGNVPGTASMPLSPIQPFQMQGNFQVRGPTPTRA